MSFEIYDKRIKHVVTDTFHIGFSKINLTSDITFGGNLIVTFIDKVFKSYVFDVDVSRRFGGSLSVDFTLEDLQSKHQEEYLDLMLKIKEALEIIKLQFIKTGA